MHESTQTFHRNRTIELELPDSLEEYAPERELLDLSVVIVNWNTRDLLLRCVRAVYSTVNELDFEVFVVDNGSTDGSKEALSVEFPQVHVLANEENLGFARANNQALRKAIGRYCLLLNTDAFVHPGAIESLVRTMEEYPDSGAVGPRLLYENGELQYSCFSFPSIKNQLWQTLGFDRLFKKNPIFGEYRMTHWDYNSLREVDSIMGACLLLRRQALAEVGLLDESFFMYSEEVDLCYRLKQAGWKVRFVPTATATHIWGGSSSMVNGARSKTSSPPRANYQDDYFLHLYKSRVSFFRKHYGRQSASGYKILLFIESLSRLLIGPPILLIFKSPEYAAGIRNYWNLARNLRTF